jgi:thiamine biosynthesis lipoprotein
MRKPLGYLLPLLALPVTGCVEDRETFFAMDTVVELYAVGGDRTVEEARRAIEGVEGWADCRDTKSEVYRLNRSAGGGPVRVSTDLAEVLDVSLTVAEESGGAFDPTILPLVEAYGFGEQNPRAPGREELEALLTRVDFRRVELHGTEAEMPAGFALDLGGVAKGYAVDGAVRAMRKAGAEAGLVNIGGDIAVFGERPGGGPWTIGIQHPREPGELYAVLELTDSAVATSGDYERYFIEGGLRYHHLLDPATGLPARGLASVTVTAPSCILADAYATAVFVLGPERGLEFLEDNDDLEGILIYPSPDGGLAHKITTGLADRLRFPEKGG